MLNISRDVLQASLGGGCGVIIPEVLLRYVETQFGATVPGVDAFIPAPWNRWSILIPIATGVPALLAGLFMRNSFSGFLMGYGVSSTVNGVVRGVFEMPSAGLRRSRRPAMRRPMPLLRVSHPEFTVNGNRKPTGSYGHRDSKTREMSETSYSTKTILS